MAECRLYSEWNAAVRIMPAYQRKQRGHLMSILIFRPIKIHLVTGQPHTTSYSLTGKTSSTGNVYLREEVRALESLNTVQIRRPFNFRKTPRGVR